MTPERNAPVVTVGLPVFNGERYLSATVSSILAQTFSSFELLISDNASTDHTLAICERFAAADPRVRILRNDTNKGATWNFNHVARSARGEYFIWAAHDDDWHPDCLSRYVDALESEPDAVLVYGHAQPVDSDGRPNGLPVRGFRNVESTPAARFLRSFELQQCHAAIYGLMRSQALRKTRLVLTSPMQDLILVLEMALQGHILELEFCCGHKRVPDRGARYRTRKELTAHLDPTAKSPSVFEFPRLTAVLRSVESLNRYGLDRDTHWNLTQRMFRLYVRNLLSVDAKESSAGWLAEVAPGLLSTISGIRRLLRSRIAST
jgi:glycosyltransferase involved in cell wall biosynthesis